MTPIKQALDALNQNDKVKARAILTNLIKVEPQNIDAWLLLAKILDDPKQASYCNERAQAVLQARIKQNTSEVNQKILSTPQVGTAELETFIQNKRPSGNIQPVSQTKVCPLCTSPMPINARVCPTCGKDIINEQHDNLYRLADSIGNISKFLIIAGILLPICVCLIGALFTK